MFANALSLVRSNDPAHQLQSAPTEWCQPLLSRFAHLASTYAPGPSLPTDVAESCTDGPG